MLSTFVRTERGCQRHLGTPFGPFLDGYLRHRHAQGFANTTIASDLKWATSFGEYLVGTGAVVADLDEPMLDAFCADYRAHPRCRGPKRVQSGGSTSLRESLLGSVRALLAYLRSIGTVPPAVVSGGVPAPYGAVLEDYLSFLRQHRGFAPRTVDQHQRWGAAFLMRMSLCRPPVELAQLRVEDVEEAAVALCEGLERRSRQIMRSTIESLVRYLRGAGHIPSSCIPFLPRLRTYALAALPSAVPWELVERAVEGVDRSDPMGMRDCALLLLLTTYGLRSAEVVGLQLDDVDWRQEVIHVRQTKTRRTLDLPLVPRVRDAIVEYLRKGRPVTRERAVFFKCHAPRGPITHGVLYAVVRKALLRVGIEAAHYGPHAIRHARATALLRSGHSLKTIGDLLGHRVPEATLIYCKLDLEALRAVALELPEVRS